MDPFAERGKPIDRLITEDEPDVPVGNLVSPTAHRGGRHLLLQQPSRDVHAIKPERGDIQEQRPTARGPHHRKSRELLERLVATSLPFGVRRGQILVSHSKGDTCSDLVEPAGYQAVIDMNARDIVDEITGRNDPPDAPGDHALLERR